jgi:hypothetical protein
MTNSLANSQAMPLIPTIVVRSAGPHRRNRQRNVVLSHESEKSYMAEPKAFPPHPPLLSGGWYRGVSFAEVLGPGRYPPDESAGRPVGTAVALGLVGGPIGLGYISLPGGVVCLLLTLVGLLLFGLIALPAGWLAAMVWGGISASRGRRRYPRH